ncbi:MAG TPA: DNA polymerase IV [Bacteroidales bacterium]|nr:DNA polymerase IV [Bacteroidales bacterium]
MDTGIMTDKRTIVHLDMDTFFVSVERLRNSRLQGIPVIVGGLSERSVVAGCSYEARTFGVHSAMPVKMARMLCPHGIFIRGDMETYTRYSRMVTDIIAEKAPLFEKASIDEHYLDISGIDRFWGSVKWTHELRETIIRNTGLPISVGISINKTVSKIATGIAKPNGELQVQHFQVQPFLDPLSINKIPMIGQKTYHLLRSMGVATIYTLSRMPCQLLEAALGKNGIIIWKKANGIDHTPVEPYSERKSLSTETTFESDTTDVIMLNNLLTSMTEKLAYQLRQKQKLTSCITVKIRYSNFDTHTIQQHIPYASMDHLLLPVIKNLFARVYKRRLLVRLIGIRFSQLVSGVQQIALFDDTQQMSNLYNAIDRMKVKYGAYAVRRAAAMQINRIRG